MAQIVPRVWLGCDSMITALGFSTEEALDGICSGRSGCRRVDDPSLYGQPFTAGLVDRGRLDKLADAGGIGDYTRLEQMFILTVGDVLRRSGVDPADRRTLFVISTTKGNIDLLKGSGEVDQRAFLHTMAGRAASFFGAANPPVVISNACISGVSAIIAGARLIREGLYDNIIVAGGDLATKFVTAGFHAFKSVSAGVCRPYDAERDGLTLGEGCAAVLLTADAGLAGGVPVEVAGGSVSNDANHISGPSRTGDGLWFAIRGAMEQAALPDGAAGFVNGHGTGTVYNDEMESKAFALGGLTGLPVNSLKPWFGHTLGASGVIETIVSAHELRRGMVFGTPEFVSGGTTHPLDVSDSHRAMALDYCVKTASGFGGCNAAVVLKKPGACEGKREAAMRGAEIRETARWSLTGSVESFHDRIRALYRELGPADIKFSKMDDLSKLGCVAAGHLLREAGVAGKYAPERIGLVLANRSASLDTDVRHQRIVEQDLPEGASPAVFVYTLPNVAAGEICIRHKIQGESTFFIQDAPDMRFVGDYARMLLKNGYLYAVVFGWCELFGEDYNADFTLIETTQ